MDGSPIKTVVVAGDGIVAWSAAAAIRRRLPMLSVSVVPTPVSPAAFADTIDSTLPSIVEFHRDILLDDADVMLRARSGIRLGTEFEAWTDDADSYIHAYGDYGISLGAAPFHQHWLRAAALGQVEPFESYSIAAQMGRADKFASAEIIERSSVGRFGYGLHIDPPRYREMMRAYALHLGATERRGTLNDVRLSGDKGSIEALRLTDGSKVAGDLFVDATGPDARVRGALGGDWDDWSSWLIADRILCCDADPGPSRLLDRVRALPGGWSWNSASQIRTSLGLVYCSRYLGDGAAQQLFADTGPLALPGKPVPIRQGRWAQPWSRNCLAIGDSAVGIEPLEWTNLHLAHNAIDRLIAMMPDAEFSPAELWDYNRQIVAEIDRVRDFLMMHYVTSKRTGDPFWKEASSVALPSSLEHTLVQFRERGRLPFYEEETFTRDGWLAVLLGQGIKPRRVDPLIDVIPPEQSARAMAHLSQAVSRLVRSLPAHSEFLEALRQKVA